MGGTRVKNQRWQGGVFSILHLVITVVSPNILHEYVGCIKDFLENKGKYYLPNRSGIPRYPMDKGKQKDDVIVKS